MEDKNDSLEVQKPVNLETPMDELTDRILNETDIEQLDKIKSIFDLNIKKKEILRVNKLNELQDLTVEEMSNRLQKRSGEFSNQDLLGYFKTIQETISKSDTSLDSVDTAAIKVIQNQLNINVNSEPELNRESKERVLEAIRAILNKPTISEESNIEDIVSIEEDIV